MDMSLVTPSLMDEIVACYIIAFVIFVALAALRRAIFGVERFTTIAYAPPSGSGPE